MARWKSLSPGARLARMRRNQAALGTRWQEKPCPPRSDLDRAMDIWQAKDAYEAMWYLPLLILVLLVVLVVLVLTGVGWLLR